MTDLRRTHRDHSSVHDPAMKTIRDEAGVGSIDVHSANRGHRERQ